MATIKTHADLRLLVLHRVLSADPLLTPVIRPPGFSLDACLAADQAVTVLADGRLQVLATVQQTQQLSWWLMGFGESVEVLAPPQLREAMRRTAARLAARYAAADESAQLQS